MKERYLKAMGKTSTQVTFGTFHGVFYAILRHTYRMSGNNILSEEEKKRLMRELVNHYARDLEEEDEKKLSIAVKALKYYANSNCWNDCLYNGRIKVSAYLQTAGYKTAQQALKEIEKCVKNMD